METSKELSVKTSELARKLNENVFAVIGSDNMMGFEKAYLIANATAQLKGLLTPEYMKPIMQLQGNRLGFRTDKDASGGYSEDVVKNCLIEAVLTGVQPFGNQFNIIAGNCYITKEGFGHLLNNWPGLDWEVIPGLPRIDTAKQSAAIVMRVVWSLNGIARQSRELDIPVKVNNYMGTDAVIGKATRKARAWLHGRLSGVEIGDGDASEMDAKTISIDPEVTLDQLKAVFEEKLALLTKAEMDSAKRIIDNQETASYRKLFNLLTSKTDGNDNQ